MLKQQTSPVGMDVQIQKLQKTIHDRLLTKWGLTTDQYLSYDRCYRNKKDTGYIAEVFEGNGEYKEVFWNDTVSVVSFFGVSDKVAHNMVSEAPIHLVFFVDLKKVKPTRTNRPDEEVRKDVTEIIGASLHGFSYSSVELWVENVLREYNGTRRDGHLKTVDMHPVHCFRINMLLRYNYKKCAVMGITPAADSPDGSAADYSDITNWTDFTLDQLNGVATFTGGTGESARTAIVINLPSNITYTGGIMNAEGVTWTRAPFGGAVCTEITYLTPQHFHNNELESGPIVIAWRRQQASSPYSGLTPWAYKEITVTRLARRWYRVQRTFNTVQYDLYPGFASVLLYDVAGTLLGQPTTIDGLVSMWNAASANAHWQIIEVRHNSGFYEFRIEPHESETAYPIQYVHYAYP